MRLLDSYNESVREVRSFIYLSATIRAEDSCFRRTARKQESSLFFLAFAGSLLSLRTPLATLEL